MRETLREQQFGLARYVRDPGRHAPPPGIEKRRVRLYRELFFNNIEGLLSAGFPVIRQTLGDARWKTLVQAFFARHRSRTALFPRIASEFVDYVDARAGDADMPPWLPELAHYEWLEQDLYTSDAPLPAHDPAGDVRDHVLALSPLVRVLAYRWPVHEIGPGHVPLSPPDTPTTLLMQRDATHQVRFTHIAPLVHRLLSGIDTTAATGRAHLAALASEFAADPHEIQVQGAALLDTLRSQGVVLATTQ